MAKRPAKPKPAVTPYRVFVSHATADKWIATVMCEKIDAIPGAATFRDDRDIAGGEVIQAALLESFRGANEMLVLLTPISVSRPRVLHEIGAMFALEKRIVPIFHQVEVTHFPPLVTAAKGYPLNSFDNYLADLTKRVKERQA